jgi:hypothetical protein
MRAEFLAPVRGLSPELRCDTRQVDRMAKDKQDLMSA